MHCLFEFRVLHLLAMALSYMFRGLVSITFEYVSTIDKLVYMNLINTFRSAVICGYIDSI